MTRPTHHSPLKKGWLCTLCHTSLAYAATMYLTKLNTNIDVAFVEDYVGLNKWLSWKGIDLRTLDAAALSAGIFSPLGLAAWHWFAIDARPRRPVPKFWHSMVPAAYLTPLIVLLAFQPSTTRSPSFCSPMLTTITDYDLGISLMFSGFAWLSAGLAYMTILPLVELSAPIKGRN